MKKETIAAVIFGVLLGVIGALILIGKARLMGTSSSKSIPNSKNISPAASAAKPTQLLVLAGPTNLSIFETNSMTIKGKASAGGLIVIQSPIKEVILTVEKDSFSTDFPLALGENVISVNLYPKDPKASPQQKILKIYYLDEK